ncbi:MAG: hypothetical protein Harvfovirus55_10 [Harvfovirus sp.]|uniref:Uncharacterized protein n=1 Tax=Harvfovirus sp. TaxID=2487768 RepID=A0A3G5A651_9VIRU|nr:MAG: hypothetical protein Harvfovirus55_10 [Harvfovirus sp.]
MGEIELYGCLWKGADGAFIPVYSVKCHCGLVHYNFFWNGENLSLDNAIIIDPKDTIEYLTFRKKKDSLNAEKMIISKRGIIYNCCENTYGVVEINHFMSILQFKDRSPEIDYKSKTIDFFRWMHDDHLKMGEWFWQMGQSYWEWVTGECMNEVLLLNQLTDDVIDKNIDKAIESEMLKLLICEIEKFDAVLNCSLGLLVISPLVRLISSYSLGAMRSLKYIIEKMRVDLRCHLKNFQRWKD